jgi:lactate dehydrogenase-like 2-hydroxyacid dehydrogenase
MMRSRLIVALTRRLPDPIEAALAHEHDLRLPPGDSGLSPGEIRGLLETCDVLVPTVADPIGADVIPARPHTRLIANYGVGVNHIDLAAARAAGIVVTNTPGVLTDATAELAITLMLMTARRAGEGERQLRKGEWQGWTPTHLPGIGLAGRRLGIVGMGRIGIATARKAVGLGMTIRYHNRSPVPPARLAGLETEAVDNLDQLVREADVLSLHCPLTPETHHLFDARRLALMRSGALLINTARGAVVDEEALVRVLEAGQLAGCGLDVYEREPAVHPGLLASERAVLLPHMGSGTIEARLAMGDLVRASIAALARGESPPNIVR